MARYKYQGTFKDGDGKVVGALTTSDGEDGLIYVYLAGTTTAADVYEASSGGSAVNYVETNDYGYFYFWVDDSDYDSSQLFKISLVHGDYETQSYDNIAIVPNVFTVDTTAAGEGTDGTISSRSASALGECDGFVELVITGGTTVYVPYWEDITPS